jgi:tRNA A-37 threonylcarbamoyl transferase component Bud32
MSRSAIRWKAGDPELCGQIERASARLGAGAKPIHSSARRTLHLLTLGEGEGRHPPGVDAHENIGADKQADLELVVLKIFHRRHGLRTLRDSIKRTLGHSAAQREWRSLIIANARGLSVPEPLGYGRLVNGEEVLAMRYIPGRSLHEALSAPGPDEWKTINTQLALALHAFHDAGLRHGDLHAGNLRLADGGIVILDLQRTRRSRGQRDQLMDLAQLVFSLQRSGVDPLGLNALRERLGIGAELDEAIRRFCLDYQRGRTRRQLRVGGDWERLSHSPQIRGIMTREFDREALHASLFSTHTLPRARLAELPPQHTEVRRTDRIRVVEWGPPHHRLISKAVAAGSTARLIADRFRGSAGARAFRRGQADRLISDRAAPVLAYLDFRRAGFPVSSWLFMEKVGDHDLDSLRPDSPDEAQRIACALGGWLAEQHAVGLFHRDLKGGNVRVRVTSEKIDFWLVDLEELAGPRRIPESDRMEALSQLNASLGDSAFDLRSRMAGLAAYAERLPFEPPLESIAREIAERSRTRRHRWRGEDCRPEAFEED